MATKLYVGNLPYSMTDDQLKQTFEPAGEVVSANVITDKMSGRSRGFGFVEMAEDGAKAIEMFDGKELEGRKLVVNEARPKTDRPPRSGGFGGGGHGGGYGGGGYGGGGGNRY